MNGRIASMLGFAALLSTNAAMPAAGSVTVVSAKWDDGSVLKGATIFVLEVDGKRDFELMGKGVTDSKGAVTINYSDKAWDSGAGADAAPDICVVAVAGDRAALRIVGMSEVHENAHPTLKVSLVAKHVVLPPQAGRAKALEAYTTKVSSLDVGAVMAAVGTMKDGPQTDPKWRQNHDQAVAQAKTVDLVANTTYPGKDSLTTAAAGQFRKKSGDLLQLLGAVEKQKAQGGTIDYMPSDRGAFALLRHQQYLLYKLEQCQIPATDADYKSRNCDCDVRKTPCPGPIGWERLVEP